VHDLESRPVTRMTSRRSHVLRIAITVATTVLMAGCASSTQERPTEPAARVNAGTPARSPQPSSTQERPTKPASRVNAATTARSTRPSSTLEGPFGQVGGWIAYSSGDGIRAVHPQGPGGWIRLSRKKGNPIAWSSDGSKLLIRRDTGLSVLDADGTETRLTDGDDDPTGGSFSPDGSEVVYAAGPWERSAIYAVSSDGGAPRLILRSTRRVSFPDGHSALAFAYLPALSPDGTRIAYFDGMYDHSHNLWVANADGTGRRVILDDELSEAGHMRALTWSPDGEALAFTTDGSLYVVRPDGTGLRRVVSGGFATAPAVQWSPDGSRIAYFRTGGTCVSLTGKDEDFICEAGGLSIVNVDGSDKHVIEGIGTTEPAWIAWNPMG
jgi:dipeptidyl aminopeptidase/acylaminoacyl peptidase